MGITDIRPFQAEAYSAKTLPSGVVIHKLPDGCRGPYINKKSNWFVIDEENVEREMPAILAMPREDCKAIGFKTDTAFIGRTGNVYVKENNEYMKYSKPWYPENIRTNGYVRLFVPDRDGAKNQSPDPKDLERFVKDEYYPDQSLRPHEVKQRRLVQSPSVSLAGVGLLSSFLLLGGYLVYRCLRRRRPA